MARSGDARYRSSWVRTEALILSAFAVVIGFFAEMLFSADY
jgi:hypothetical protein